MVRELATGKRKRDSVVPEIAGYKITLSGVLMAATLTVLLISRPEGLTGFWFLSFLAILLGHPLHQRGHSHRTGLHEGNRVRRTGARRGRRPSQ